MSIRVDPELIEGIVGAPRHDTEHIARGVTSEKQFYILHPKQCLEAYEDLRECPFSRALDQGVLMDPWRGWEDRPVIVEVGDDGRVHPVREAS